MCHSGKGKASDWISWYDQPHLSTESDLTQSCLSPFSSCWAHFPLWRHLPSPLWSPPRATYLSQHHTNLEPTLCLEDMVGDYPLPPLLPPPLFRLLQLLLPLGPSTTTIWVVEDTAKTGSGPRSAWSRLRLPLWSLY